MEKWKQKMAEIMEMSDPRKAMVEMATLVHREHLDLTILEEKMDEYAEKHKVDLDEMTYYPNGERVLTPEMFQ